MITDAVIARVCPLLPSGQRARYVPVLEAVRAGSTLSTPARVAAFLAQCAHESSELRLWHEVWGKRPTPAQRAYEPPSRLAAGLGNTEAGDGYRYRGRGPLMLTGRANYRRIGRILGLALEGDPDLVATTRVGFRTAVAFWDASGLSVIADAETAEAFRRITRLLNGGANGLPAREAYHADARAALGLAPLTP
jgi:putative chitinase